jgi:O-antigen/teichoic acid export membrane protein
VSQVFSIIASMGVATWLLRELAQSDNVDQTPSTEASLVGVAVAAGFGVPAIAVMYITAGIARVFVNGINIRASKHVALARASFDSLKTTLRASLPFALNAASLNIIPRLDAVILVTLSTTAAGYFALGDRVLGPAIMIPWVMGSALYPFLARKRGRSAAGWRILGLFVGAGSLVAVAGVALAPTLVPLIFGKAYDEAVDVVQVMLLAIPFVYGLNAMLAQVYTGGRERSILLVTLGMSALGTVAIVAGQLVVGATGAAGGYLLREILFLAGLVAIAALLALTTWSGRRSHSQPTAEPNCLRRRLKNTANLYRPSDRRFRMSHSRPGSTRAFTVGRPEGSPRERGLCRVSTRARGHRIRLP